MSYTPVNRMTKFFAEIEAKEKEIEQHTECDCDEDEVSEYGLNLPKFDEYRGDYATPEVEEYEATRTSYRSYNTTCNGTILLIVLLFSLLLACLLVAFCVAVAEHTAPRREQQVDDRHDAQIVPVRLEW